MFRSKRYANSGPWTLTAGLLAAALAPSAGAQAAAIEITNAGFAPQVLEVPVGTTVTWTNQEGVHTSTSDAGLWDSGVLLAGDSFSFTFDEVGVFHLGDTIHAWPSGVVEVVHSLATIGAPTTKSLYVAGDEWKVGLQVSNPGADVRVAIEVVLSTPFGVDFPLLVAPDFTLDAGFDFSTPSFLSTVLPALPLGDYGVRATITKVPEGDLIHSSETTWTFGEVRQSDWSAMEFPGMSGGAAMKDMGSSSSMWEGFESAAGASWLSIPGQIALAARPEPNPFTSVVAPDAGRPNSVALADLDGDGHDELITTDPVTDIEAKLGSIDFWRQKPDGQWAHRTVSSDFYGARYVSAADVDLDGDVDVLAAAYYGDGPGLGRNGRYAWFENVDGAGGKWTQHLVGDLFWGASHVEAGDIDGDGDIDLVGASELTDGVQEQEADLVWFENLDSVGTAWGQHDLDLDLPGASVAHLTDLDGDGDLDVVGAYQASVGPSSLAWYENDAGDASTWTKRLVPFPSLGSGYVDAGDVDGDGDVDLVGGGYNSPDVRIWENLDGLGTSWASFTIGHQFSGLGLALRDLEGDGDLDALMWTSSQVLWFENFGDDGLWGKRSLQTNLSSPWAAFGDVDGDGKLELALTSETESLPGAAEAVVSEVSYFEATGELVSSVLDGGDTPAWGMIDWTAKTPTDTSLVVEVRASNDLNDLGSFLPVTAQADLGLLFDPSLRYLQYRVRLESTDDQMSPVLQELRVMLGDGF